MKSMLIVISGAAGAGKDFVADQFIKTETALKLGITKVRTNADRPRRTDEPEDAHYFISEKELDRLERNGELAEEIVTTGFTRKATSKSEIRKIFENRNLLWRVDPTLASKIATGDYFYKYFPKEAETLKKQVVLIHIHAPQEVLDNRRKNRDKEKHKPDEYRSRDEFEKPYLNILLNNSNVNVIENLDGNLEITLNHLTEIISEHYEKINKKKD
jgi:guanylate kinase